MALVCEKQEKRCGSVAFLGKPNAGKSTLFNACLKHKIVGVSRKPQTTRDTVLGIRNVEGTQLLLYDTPGINSYREKSGSKFLRYMNKTAEAILADCDVAFYLIDVNRGLDSVDTQILRKIQTYGTPITVVLSKCDKIKNREVSRVKSELEESLADIIGQCPLGTDSSLDSRVRAMSSKGREDVESFCFDLSELMPEGSWIYQDDELTNRPQRFVLSELIREQVFRMFSKEIPFGSSVEVESVDEGDDEVWVRSVITVDKDSHKGIVIGSKGARLKSLGIDARASLESHYGKKVHLELHVAVRSKLKWQEAIIDSFS